MAVKRALISVSNKEGIVPFAKQLAELGVDIISTGGTKRALEEAGVPVISISDVTGFPEILDGRVKTLHPAIHGGIWRCAAMSAIKRRLRSMAFAQSIWSW